MEKLSMCRICLVENAHMYVVVNRNLHELYEKLTGIPFVTEDSRPILACYFCCAKLKQCYRFLRKCLDAEELFAQMMNEDCKSNPLVNQDQFAFYTGFTKSPTENISIVDGCQTESIAIKEELPDVCEGLDDNIEPKGEHESDELELENLDNSLLDVADIRPYHSESDFEYDIPLMEFKTEVEEEQEVRKKKRRARKTTRATVAKKRKLDTRRTKLEDAEQTKKAKSGSKVIRKSQKRMSKTGTHIKEPYKCDQRSFNEVKINKKHTGTRIGGKPYKCDVCQRSFTQKCELTSHIRVHTGEKPFKCVICERNFRQKGNLTKHIRIHTGEKPYKCDVCQRRFNEKGTLKKHIRIHTGVMYLSGMLVQRIL